MRLYKNKGSQPKDHNNKALRLNIILLFIQKRGLTKGTLLYCVRLRWMFSMRLHLEKLKCVLY
jgi:hypothetical protein